MTKSKKKQHSVVLLLGSNLGDRARYLDQARALIEKKIGPISQHSSIFETQPWQVEDHDSYYNQAVIVLTSCPPGKLMKDLLRIEAVLGRTRKDTITPRVIDIDMMFYGKRNIIQKKLTIPHPRLHLRRFALIPLCEVMPDFIHPLLKKKLKVILSECQDDLKVSPIESK